MTTSFSSFLRKRLILLEGGADGHMSHLWEIANITFGDLRDIFTDLFKNNIKLTEKTDGQNLNVTFKDGEIKAARNKATLRDPMSIDDVAALFDNRGEIKNAFVNSMTDLQAACKALTPEQLAEIFNNGLNFMSIEIIYPPTKNVVYYDDRCLIQFHGINKFNDKLEKIGQDDSLALKLYNYLKDKNVINQSVFELTEPNFLKIKNSLKATEDLNIVLSDLSELVKGLGYNITVADYVKEKLKPTIIDIASDLGIYVSPKSEFVDKLAERYSPISIKRPTKNDLIPFAKAENIDPKSPNYKEFLNTLATLDKSVINESLMSVEKVVAKAGALLISNLTGFVSTDRSHSAQQLADELTSTIDNLKHKDDLTPDQLKKLEYNLNKLKNFGETPTGIEGIVFVWKDRVIKMTANFGPINQILGLLKFVRVPSTEPVKEAIIDATDPANKTLVLVAGSFKPPHAGHLDMVLKYADKADTIKILISNPQSEKSLRKTKSGTVITPEISKQIWEIYLKRYNLTDKVSVEVSSHPSPITAISKFIEETRPMENIILGVSNKDGDAKRFTGILKYFADDENLKIVDPLKTAVEPYQQNGEAVSATDIRNNIDNIDIIKKLLPAKLTDDDITTVTKLLK